MRCILKRAEKAPEFIEVNSQFRADAVREVLGEDITPGYYTLTGSNSFIICYNALWFITDVPINFFATLPVGTNRPVEPIMGDALFLRLQPISDFAKVRQDYTLLDCTEGDMEYLKKALLTNKKQHSLYGTVFRMVKTHIKNKAPWNPYSAEFSRLLTRWKNVHPEDSVIPYLGGMTRKKPFLSTQDEETYNLRRKSFYPSSFENYCDSYNLTCAFYDGLIYVKTPLSTWRIHHHNCCALQLEQNDASRVYGSGQTKELWIQHELPSPDIYRVARHIAKMSKFI